MKTLTKQFKLVALFTLIFLFLCYFTLISCSEEEIDCIIEQSKIARHYDELIEEATGNIEEQETLLALRTKELEDFDCLSRWDVK